MTETRPTDAPAGTDTSDAVAMAVARLLDAAAAGTPCSPVRDLIGPDDVDAAYAVQQRIAAARTGAGGRVVGRKIGLTSVAVQQQLGVYQPDFGVLFEDMGYLDGDTVPYASVPQPKVEAEVAFLLGADLVDGELDLAHVRAAVDEMAAALEICSSRIAGWDITFADTIADNASAGAYVLGSTRRRLADVDPREVVMTMSIDGDVVSTGDGAACMGDPLLALQWLARRARELGDPLRAGQVVLSGALGPMRPVAPGAQVRAVISGLGEVSVRFSAEGAT